MRRRFGLLGLLVSLAAAAGAAAQANPTAAPPAGEPHTDSQRPAPLPVLHAGTQLVLVDVVVQDRNGRPVHGLTRDSFAITEQKKPQTVRNFEEHAAATSPKPGPALPPMPPGTFTDYTPVPTDGTLNVLLIDALNTPMTDQAYLRQQLRDFVKHERPGTSIAVFGLTRRLYLLQGFTSDPQVLKDVVEHKLLPRASVLLNDPAGSNVDTPSPSDMAQDMATGPGAAMMAETAAAMQQFEAETESFQTQLRTRYTIDAFNALAHYLANFSGRKNVIWFSGSFPINIEPDPSLNDPFSVMASSDQEFRDTTNLLTHSQVAVYPVDSRGLMVAPVFDASRSGSSYARRPQALGDDLMKFSASQAAEHATMDQMASDTGGRAFYNTNGLADAAARAIDAGTNYYTLAYTPADHHWNGAYRSIRVELTGAWAAQGLKLSYRHGYFADDPDGPRRNRPLAEAAQSPAAQASAAYAQAAITRGAPAPSDILFKVRVLPLARATADKLPPDNQPDPRGTLKPPFRNFSVDFAVVSNDIPLTNETDGRHKGEIEFDALVYDADGNLLNDASKRVTLNLSPETYQRFRASGLGFHLEVGAPARQESFLRLVVRDVPRNRFGVVEIPTAQVSRLAPPEPSPTAGATPSTPSTSPGVPAATAPAGAAPKQ